MAFTVAISQNWFIQAPMVFGPTASPTSPRNDNIEVSVFPNWYSDTSLTWKIPAAWGLAKFHVYFWLGGQEGIVRLTTQPLTDPSFKDPTAQDYSKFRNGYYIVEALLPSGQTVRSAPASWHYKRRDRLELIATEIQRREFLLLSKFNGVKSYLFRKKYYGLRCHRCWNPTTEKVMDDHCTVCFGTSFEGGYFDPLPLYINFDPTPNEIMKVFVGRTEPNMISSYTISLPEITADDIIIRTGDWNVYQVLKIQTTEMQANTIRQMMALTQLGKGDVENKLALRIENAASSTYLENMGGEFNAQRFPQNLVDKVTTNEPQWSQDMVKSNLPKYTV